MGSNIGNKLENCQNGINLLTKNGTNSLKIQSRFYKTEPVDYKDQDWFINGVAKIETCLKPVDLLKTLKEIEYHLGRSKNGIRFGPRILDMDILLYDDWVINSPELTIPHPRMQNRCFVLRPLCDIDPSIVHPVLKKDMQHLLNKLDSTDQEVFCI